MRVILASKSKERKILFNTIFDNFEVIDSNFDESLVNSKNPKKLVEKLAEGKCESVFNSTNGQRLVVGSDTVVTINNEIFGKPKDEDDARRMLRAYSGKVNKVITGVCIKYENSDEIETKIIFSTSSSIKFREISEEEINKFIATKEYVGVAGACTIEGIAGKFMEKVVGSYHSILGLPTAQLYNILKNENLV